VTVWVIEHRHMVTVSDGAWTAGCIQNITIRVSLCIVVIYKVIIISRLPKLQQLIKNCNAKMTTDNCNDKIVITSTTKAMYEYYL
jgi:hypothetical protein